MKKKKKETGEAAAAAVSDMYKRKREIQTIPRRCVVCGDGRIFENCDPSRYIPISICRRRVVQRLRLRREKRGSFLLRKRTVGIQHRNIEGCRGVARVAYIACFHDFGKDAGGPAVELLFEWVKWGECEGKWGEGRRGEGRGGEGGGN